MIPAECVGCGTTLNPENGDQETLCLCCWLGDYLASLPPREFTVDLLTDKGWVRVSD